MLISSKLGSSQTLTTTVARWVRCCKLARGYCVVICLPPNPLGPYTPVTMAAGGCRWSRGTGEGQVRGEHAVTSPLPWLHRRSTSAVAAPLVPPGDGCVAVQPLCSSGEVTEVPPGICCLGLFRCFWSGLLWRQEGNWGEGWVLSSTACAGGTWEPTRGPSGGFRLTGSAAPLLQPPPARTASR